MPDANQTPTFHHDRADRSRMRTRLASGPAARGVVLLLALVLPGLAYGETQTWDAALATSLERMATSLTTTLVPWTVPERVFRVRDFGAVGDGTTCDTRALQAAIDACSAAGGGVVLLERGDFLSGTLDLRNGVMLEVAKGARLLGSTDFSDYPPRIPAHQTVMDTWMKLTQSLIYAEHCDRIGIRGGGAIDGRGSPANFPGRNDIGAMPNRPFLIRMVECRNIVMDGITLKDSASWMQNYLDCDNLIAQGVQVENLANWNNDAFDIDGCRNVIVRHCTSVSVDDGLCFKGAGLRTMENVLVEDCEFRTPCNAIKFGTDSQGGFRNVLIRNVVIGGTDRVTLHHQRQAISGISLQSVDGGVIEDVLMRDVRLDHAESAFCLRLGDRGRVKPDMPRPAPGAIRRIILENITGTDLGKRGSIISGIPGAAITDLLFRNITLAAAGGGSAKDADRTVPELANAYPDAFSFGATVPAHGFWIRHTRNATFDQITVTTANPDARKPFVLGADTSDIRINSQNMPANAAMTK